MESLIHDSIAHCHRLIGINIGDRFIEYKRLPDKLKDYALHRPGVEAVRVNGTRVSFVWHSYEQPHQVDDCVVRYNSCKWKEPRRGDMWK